MGGGEDGGWMGEGRGVEVKFGTFEREVEKAIKIEQV